jgi:NitT/TauT family transport system ATP-binding protein
MSDPIIALTGVTKLFNQQVAVQNFTLAIAPGQLIGLVGQTGAGKTTVLNLILGQIAPTSGTVLVDGYDPYREFNALRGKVAVSFQSDRLIPWRTALENVQLGLEILHRSKADRRLLASYWLERVKLASAHHDKYPHQLSGGMRQRVSLARALVVDPDIVLLDESFSQLDHITSKTLRADFLLLVRQLRKTCVLITHRIDDAVDMSDRVIVLATPGEIRAEIPLSDVERADLAARAAITRSIAIEMAGATGATEESADFATV